MEEDGERLLNELEGTAESGLQRIPGADDFADAAGDQLPREPGVIDFIEEYAFLALIVAIIAYFLYKKGREWTQAIRYTSSVKQAENGLRRARMLQQAKYEVETAQKREELEKIEEERRKQKLEEMEAMMEGRSAKKSEKKDPGSSDHLDRGDGFNPLTGSGGGGRGGGGRYQPTTRRRG
mmetsp:Transcript_2664/g.7430  ORF Transcript_2664/g.7430 Transcript_2664/m.7430 type:complete len:180 (-) Transcript_2664:144-683(-)